MRIPDNSGGKWCARDIALGTCRLSMTVALAWFLQFSRRALWSSGGDDHGGIRFGGDDEDEGVAAAVAGGQEAAGVGAFDAHLVLAVGTNDGHRYPPWLESMPLGYSFGCARSSVAHAA